MLGTGTRSQKSVQARNLLIIAGITFNIFLIMDLSLGILPYFAHKTLGDNNATVGLVIGLQYVAMLLTRQSAGRLSDTKGERKSIAIGLALSGMTGI